MHNANAIAYEDATVTHSLEALERELTTLAGHLNAGNYRFLMLLDEFDRREGYVGFGIASCAHWLSWRCGIGMVAARDKLRVARALRQLPKLSEAMRRGVVSYCKVRAITRIATPKNEDLLLQIAQAGTVSHVEKTVRLYRRAERAEELAQANQRHACRHFQYFVDDDGSVVVKGRLAPEQGALLVKAMRAAADALREAERDSREAAMPPDIPRDDQHARNADALTLMAETLLASGVAPLGAGERHLVHVHIEEQVLRDETNEGRAELEDQTSVPPATVRRLCCDGSLLPITEDASGNVLNLGRKTRAIPSAMRRALERRDAGCRFPGCTNTRFVDAHHIVHWADGGQTALDNLVLLCRRHHRFLHEHGYRVVRATGGVEFQRPDGRRVLEPPRAAPISAHVGCQQLFGAHTTAGIEIDHDTGDSHWNGESMDYAWVMRSLLDERGSDLNPAPGTAERQN